MAKEKDISVFKTCNHICSYVHPHTFSATENHPVQSKFIVSASLPYNNNSSVVDYDTVNKRDI